MNTPPVAMPFVGIWPALLTPLHPDLSIDLRRLGAHALCLLEAGCGGVTPFGTTGEGPSFTVDERRAAVDWLVEAGVPAQRILVSTSAAALPDVEALTRHALAIGAHGCLMLPPFYLKGVPDAGVIDAYRYLIDRVADARLRLYLYHIPQVTAVGLSQHVIATLKRLYPDTIVGIKDSQCERAHSVALADAFMRDVRVYVGFEPDLPELARRGSTGAVSGLANFMPRLVHALVAEHASTATALRVARVRDLLTRLEPYALIPALKGIMALLDGDTGWLRVRPPLVALEAGALAALRQSIGAVGIDRATD